MYNTGFRENLHSYVNNINTIEGGTHEAGFRMALTRVLKKYAEDSKALEKAKVEIPERTSARTDCRHLRQVRAAVRRTDQDEGWATTR